MGATKIEWADRVWNPVTGCSKVSSGCRNCYAETIAKRFWGERPFTNVRCHEDRLAKPVGWRKAGRVFVNSMSDLFHPHVPPDFVRRTFDVMGLTPQHTYMVLTKRPDRMRAFCDRFERAPAKNIWLGVSVEDQTTAHFRVPALIDTPASVRWVSAEPLLGSLSLAGPRRSWIRHLNWVVVGGESGPKARPMNPAWARYLRVQCHAHGVPFFMKQMSQADQKDHKTLPYDLQVQQYPEATL